MNSGGVNDRRSELSPMRAEDIIPAPAPAETINHPAHYGGDTVYETIKIIRAQGWLKEFCLGNALKYMTRAGKKEKVKELEDLKKARWYLDYLIKDMEAGA